MRAAFMGCRARPRARSRVGGAALGGLLVLLQLLLLPGQASVLAQAGFGTGLAAQSPVALAEARYQEALAEYDAARLRFERTYSLSEQALERINMARRSGDSAREQQAQAGFLTQSLEVMEAEGAARRAAQRLRVANRELLDALGRREAELIELLDRDGNDPATIATLNAEWAAVRRRTIAVDDAVGGLEEELTIRPLRELTVDPRDGPAELRLKADFMEDEAAQYQAVIDDLDRRIDEAERQIQQQRVRGDLFDDVQRFDADFIPGGRLSPRSVPSGRDDVSGGQDDAAGALAQLSLAEQVALYRAVRDQSVQNRDLALVQAELFRVRAEGGRP